MEPYILAIELLAIALFLLAIASMAKWHIHKQYVAEGKLSVVSTDFSTFKLVLDDYNIEYEYDKEKDYLEGTEISDWLDGAKDWDWSCKFNEHRVQIGRDNFLFGYWSYVRYWFWYQRLKYGIVRSNIID